MLLEEEVNIFYFLDYANSIWEKKITSEEIRKLKQTLFPGQIKCNNPLFLQSRKYTYGMRCLSSLLIQDVYSLTNQTDTINKYFGGELRDYILSSQFYSICRNKKLNSTDDNIDNFYAKYSGKMMDKIYNDLLDFSYDKYKKLGNPFPANILSEKLISLVDSTEISLKDLLDKYKGKQIMIDNWASWCGPCKHEIKIGKKKVQELENKNMKFIYISLDRGCDYNKAKESAISLGICDQAYIIKDDFKSQYAKYLNFKSIPKFILLDVNGQIQNLNHIFPSQIRDVITYKKN